MEPARQYAAFPETTRGPSPGRRAGFALLAATRRRDPPIARCHLHPGAAREEDAARIERAIDERAPLGVRVVARSAARSSSRRPTATAPTPARPLPPRRRAARRRRRGGACSAPAGGQPAPTARSPSGRRRRRAAAGGAVCGARLAADMVGISAVRGKNCAGAAAAGCGSTRRAPPTRSSLAASGCAAPAHAEYTAAAAADGAAPLWPDGATCPSSRRWRRSCCCGTAGGAAAAPPHAARPADPLLGAVAVSAGSAGLAPTESPARPPS